jgi:glycosyltransferase involved in cell wall biosynthesis
LKLSWFSNAPWASTGYGNQTALFAPRIAAEHELAIIANYGLEAGATTWHGIPVYPKGFAGHSEDIGLAHSQAWGADWMLTLYDVWPLLPMPGQRDARIASWVPVDHYPVPPQVLEWCRSHYTIAMTEFGQRSLAEAGVDARYIPHGVDTAVFKPTPSDVRKVWQIPDDAFLVMINAANKGGTPVRKAWSEMLSAYALFSAGRDDVYLYVHTNLAGIGGTAPNLELLMGALGLDEHRVRIVGQYDYLAGRISNDAMAQLYSAADVLLATSMGEGFGIPVIEAQACGTPAIVTDFSAQTELAGPGWRVGFQPWWDHFQGSWLATPLIKQIVLALEDAYAKRGTLREASREFALGYDADLVYDRYWRPVLADLAAQLEPKQLTRQQRRAKTRQAA